MTKEDMVSVISRDTGYNRYIVSNILESMMTNITHALSNGRKVQFAGFGTFEPKKRAARTGRNPHTGEMVPIPARVIPSFSAGKNLKSAVVKQVK